jgi:hypothetical protein
MKRLLPFTWLLMAYIAPYMAGAQNVGRAGEGAASISSPAPAARLPQHDTPRARAAGALEVTTLIRVWVAESRWTADRDHDIQAHVLLRYARRAHVSLAVAADRLVWRFSRPPRWVRQLTPACVQPRSWPARLRWSAHRPLSIALRERAAGLLRGEISDPCGEASGWRSPGRALVRAERRGWERVDCGVTHTVFVRRHDAS